MTDPVDCTIGFVGLGVMGAPMCRNMAKKHAGRVICFDVSPASMAAVVEAGAEGAASLAEIGARAEVVFLSLPGAAQVEAVCLGEGGLASGAHKPAMIVDLSTTSVTAARQIGSALSARGIAFVDAPVARTREAAQRGELSIMVGASTADFTAVEPLLRHIGSDVSHCGDIGCGQVVKLVNNALVFENTLALAEMMVIAERAGVSPATLLDAVAKGSGDSFVLRNHGRKSLLPRDYPERAFPPEYAVKDLEYVQELAADTGVRARVVEQALEFYRAAIRNGGGGRYFPVVRELIEAGIDPAPAGANAEETSG